MIDHVAIVGGGFSGTLLAINLLRHEGPRATLIERRLDAGEGLAFGAAHPSHLLNVRAGNMSAFPDDPGHFVRWLEGQGIADAGHAFIPRLTYGRYLRELLDAAQVRGGTRLTVLAGDVVDLTPGETARLALQDGRSIAADAVVLAVGNLPPHAPPGIPDALPAACYAPDPWAPSALHGLGPDDTVLVLGTGLTMVDVALSLEASGFAGRIVALSRRGLLPHGHADPAAPADPIRERPAGSLSALVGIVRARADAIGWRSAIDELRPFTQGLWGATTTAERERFLRHLRPWWDIHRHRLAPSVAERITAMRARGQLSLTAGKLASVAPAGDGLHVTWRPRGASVAAHLPVRRIINCTGPQGDLLRASEPLLQRLVARGSIRPDAARLGIDVDAQSRTVDATGAGNDWLFAAGPMTRGAFWEIVAVPDIRAQSWSLARRLSNAQWVGGEGL
uniref:FAD/NAD(P)-binding protein n=1 Tax=uncultured Sphingomonas sp. TaxID=158754 RepID=UPI0035CA5285